MDKFNKLKGLIKNYSKEQQAQILQAAAAKDPEMAKALQQKALEQQNFDKRAGYATDTYKESLKSPYKGVKITPISEVKDMQAGLKDKLTTKQKLLNAYKDDPFPKVEKQPELKPTIDPESEYIKSKVSIEDEANALKKADAGKAFDIERSNKATTLGIPDKGRFSNLKNLMSEGAQAGAKAGAKSGIKAGMKVLPIVGSIGAGLMSGADAYADTGSMKEALKAGGAEMANPTPIPTEIITGAIEDRDAIKKDLFLKDYQKEAEDKADLDYAFSPAVKDLAKKGIESKASKYEDGGIEDEDIANEIAQQKSNYFKNIKNKLNPFKKEEAITPKFNYEESNAYKDKRSPKEINSKESIIDRMNNAKTEEERYNIYKEFDNKYADGGVPFSKMNPEQKETMVKLLNTYRGLIDSEDDKDGMKLKLGREGIKRDMSAKDIPDIEKYSEKLKDLESVVDDSDSNISKNIKANNSAVKEIKAPFEPTLKDLELEKPVKKTEDIWDSVPKSDVRKKALGRILKVLGPIAAIGSAGLEAKESLDKGESIQTALEKAALSVIPIDTEVSHEALKNYKDYERHENEDEYINEAEDKAGKDYKKSQAYSDKFKNLKSRLLY